MSDLPADRWTKEQVLDCGHVCECYGTTPETCGYCWPQNALQLRHTLCALCLSRRTDKTRLTAVRRLEEREGSGE
jgi:hypothetical protein